MEALDHVLKHFLEIAAKARQQPASSKHQAASNRQQASGSRQHAAICLKLCGESSNTTFSK